MLHFFQFKKESALVPGQETAVHYLSSDDSNASALDKILLYKDINILRHLQENLEQLRVCPECDNGGY